MEQRAPGTYHQMLARAEQIQHTGGNPDGVPYEDMLGLIAQRQGSR